MSPPRYRLVVDGELGPRYTSALDAMTVSARNGTTAITGPINDSSHRQGLLERRWRPERAPLGPFEPENGEPKAQPDNSHDPPRNRRRWVTK